MGSDSVTLLGSLGVSLATEGLIQDEAALQGVETPETTVDLQSEGNDLALLLQGRRHAPIGQRMASGDADENQLTLQVSNEAALKRKILREQQKLRFLYGELADDHPAQIYIDALALRIPVQNNFIPRFFVLPDWKGINAVSLPDGTIFVSWGLLQSAETEEALLGVMAHEYVHAYRQHASKVLNVTDREMVSRILKSIGLSRLHEYEADLRGAIEILDKMKLSPIPFKEFLEKLYRSRQQSVGHGIVHGSSLDRALNIATMTPLVDLRGIEEKNCRPIPAEILQDPHQTGGTKTFRPIVDHPRFRVARGELEAERRRTERRELIERLTLEQLAHAIPLLSEQIEGNKGTRDEYPDDEIVLAKATERFTERSGAKDDITRLAHLFFFAGSRLLWRRNASTLISSPAELESLRQCFEKLATASPLEQSRIDTGGVWSFVLSLVIEQKLFEEKKSGPLDIQAFDRFIKDWSETLVKLSNRFDTVQSRTAEDFKNEVVNNRLDELIKLYPGQKVLIYKFFDKSYHPHDAELRAIAKKNKFDSLFRNDRCDRRRTRPPSHGTSGRADTPPIRLGVQHHRG